MVSKTTRAAIVGVGAAVGLAVGLLVGLPEVNHLWSKALLGFAAFLLLFTLVLRHRNTRGK